jgi:peptidoglycan/LPS O-acetylase OafA/YrhL
MPFIQQFAISYAAALLIGSLALTRGESGTMTIAITYGFFGLPFALIIGGLARLLERTFLGWSAGVVATLALLVAAYFIAPNKQNFWAGAGMTAPFAALFAAVWSFLSWRNAGAVM